jgi:malate dehydrogenase
MGAEGGWEIVQGLPVNGYSRAKIDASVKELVDERETVKDMLA